MGEEFTSKRDNEAELSLYRLMRLQNRDNSFLFRDESANIHYPLETIPRSELLRTFWKLISTHYFKKLGEEELYRWDYVHNLFNNDQYQRILMPPIFAGSIRHAQRFWSDLTTLVDSKYLQKMLQKKELKLQDVVWLKKMFIQWSMSQLISVKKTKKISKHWRNRIQLKNKTLGKHGGYKNKKQKMKLLRENLEILDEIIADHCVEDDGIECDHSQDIDQEMYRLVKQLRLLQNQNIGTISQIQIQLQAQQAQNSKQIKDKLITQEAQCIQWLIHSLEEKQIAQSVTKIVSSQRAHGSPSFLINYDNSMNIQPQLISQNQLERINKLKEISLLKFYKTGVKSLYSYTCQNFAGFSQMLLSRMSLSKVKDRDYLHILKKGAHVSPQAKQQFKEFDVCHHCKFIYPPYMLKVCKFMSDKQAMPKTLEGDAYIEPDLSGCAENLGRISQRFVSKHRNCLTGYAKINQQYYCGRKFCKSCLKDNYGQDWMKNSNGMCPFCLGACTCTRCSRSEKIYKLKSYFISIGGSIAKLQQGDLIDKLSCKKEQLYLKSKATMQKTFVRSNQMTKVNILARKSKKIRKIGMQRLQKKQHKITKYNLLYKKQFQMEEETERWSSTTEKQVVNIGRRTSRRRVSAVFTD